jgi:drug/metabolite transporter (DMT)-like permease
MTDTVSNQSTDSSTSAVAQPHASEAAITLRAVLMSVVAAFFFSLTFVLNRVMAVGGGHWGWAVVLRYVFMLVFLGGYLVIRRDFGGLFPEMRRHAGAWITWSVVGFGVFATAITWASTSGPAWLVAGVFQSTVILGPLLAPFIYKDARRRIAPRVVVLGVLMFSGVLAMQLSRGRQVAFSSIIASLGAVLLAATVWPLGNRKVMVHLEECRTHVTVPQRVFGMTLLSMLLFIPLGVYTWITVGPPTGREALLGGSVALSSGVIATSIFYKALEAVRRNRVGLAAVEAMQSCALLFSIVMGVVFIGESWPMGVAAIGAGVVMLGVILFSLLSARSQ